MFYDPDLFLDDTREYENNLRSFENLPRYGGPLEPKLLSYFPLRHDPRRKHSYEKYKIIERSREISFDSKYKKVKPPALYENCSKSEYQARLRRIDINRQFCLTVDVSNIPATRDPRRQRLLETEYPDFCYKKKSSGQRDADGNNIYLWSSLVDCTDDRMGQYWPILQIDNSNWPEESVTKIVMKLPENNVARGQQFKSFVPVNESIICVGDDRDARIRDYVNNCNNNVHADTVRISAHVNSNNNNNVKDDTVVLSDDDEILIVEIDKKSTKQSLDCVVIEDEEEDEIVWLKNEKSSKECAVIDLEDDEFSEQSEATTVLEDSVVQVSPPVEDANKTEILEAVKEEPDFEEISEQIIKDVNNGLSDTINEVPISNINNCDENVEKIIENCDKDVGVSESENALRIVADERRHVESLKNSFINPSSISCYLKKNINKRVIEKMKFNEAENDGAAGNAPSTSHENYTSELLFNQKDDVNIDEINERENLLPNIQVNNCSELIKANLQWHGFANNKLSESEIPDTKSKAMQIYSSDKKCDFVMTESMEVERFGDIFNKNSLFYKNNALLKRKSVNLLKTNLHGVIKKNFKSLKIDKMRSFLNFLKGSCKSLLLSTNCMNIYFKKTEEIINPRLLSFSAHCSLMSHEIKNKSIMPTLAAVKDYAENQSVTSQSQQNNAGHYFANVSEVCNAENSHEKIYEDVSDNAVVAKNSSMPLSIQISVGVNNKRILNEDKDLKCSSSPLRKRAKVENKRKDCKKNQNYSPDSSQITPLDTRENSDLVGASERQGKEKEIININIFIHNEEPQNARTNYCHDYHNYNQDYNCITCNKCDGSEASELYEQNSCMAKSSLPYLFNSNETSHSQKTNYINDKTKTSGYINKYIVKSEENNEREKEVSLVTSTMTDSNVVLENLKRTENHPAKLEEARDSPLDESVALVATNEPNAQEPLPCLSLQDIADNLPDTANLSVGDLSLDNVLPNTLSILPFVSNDSSVNTVPSDHTIPIFQNAPLNNSAISTTTPDSGVRSFKIRVKDINTMKNIPFEAASVESSHENSILKQCLSEPSGSCSNVTDSTLERLLKSTENSVQTENSLLKVRQWFEDSVPLIPKVTLASAIPAVSVNNTSQIQTLLEQNSLGTERQVQFAPPQNQPQQWKRRSRKKRDAVELQVVSQGQMLETQRECNPGSLQNKPKQTRSQKSKKEKPTVISNLVIPPAAPTIVVQNTFYARDMFSNMFSEIEDDMPSSIGTPASTISSPSTVSSLNSPSRLIATPESTPARLNNTPDATQNSSPLQLKTPLQGNYQKKFSPDSSITSKFDLLDIPVVYKVNALDTDNTKKQKEEELKHFILRNISYIMSRINKWLHSRYTSHHLNTNGHLLIINIFVRWCLMNLGLWIDCFAVHYLKENSNLFKLLNNIIYLLNNLEEEKTQYNPNLNDLKNFYNMYCDICKEQNAKKQFTLYQYYYFLKQSLTYYSQTNQ